MAKRISLERLLRDGSDTFKRLNAGAQAELARVENSKSKRGRQDELAAEDPNSPGMVDISGPLFVRIVRYIPDRRHVQDDDNTSGGAKSLRDAIAEFLCRKGDSEEDGLTWEYATVVGKPFRVDIEIYEVNE